MLVIPGIPLIANYYINYLYKKLWDEIDPPKPQDEEKLTREEILLINKCDENFDNWNTKYAKVADFVRKAVLFWSHKFFIMPFTHFYGYLHCTIRIQDHYCIWQWDPDELTKFINGKISQKNIVKPGY
jgi:hypothetical protein